MPLSQNLTDLVQFYLQLVLKCTICNVANIKHLQFQENMRLFLLLNSEPEEFHIYVYTKSYFYRNLDTGRLQYLSVKKGEYMKAHLSLQVNCTKQQFSIPNNPF